MEQNIIKKLFVKTLTKKGKKNKIEKVYKNLLLNIKINKKQNSINILKKSIENLLPKMEIKKVSKYKSKIVLLNNEKQLKKSIKWLTTNNISNKKVNKENIILNEVLDTLNKNSKSYKQKVEICKEAQKMKYSV